MQHYKSIACVSPFQGNDNGNLIFAYFKQFNTITSSMPLEHISYFSSFSSFKNKLHFPKPPRQAGLRSTSWEPFSHWSGVRATMERACTPDANSSLKAAFTRRWRLMRGTFSKVGETTRTLKCVSEPGGTLCIKDSLTICKWTGWKASTSFFFMADSTAPSEDILCKGSPLLLWNDGVDDILRTTTALLIILKGFPSCKTPSPCSL